MRASLAPVRMAFRRPSSWPRPDCEVEVFEAEPTPGGAARTMELTLPGFWHDFGSAVHPLAAGSPFFCALPLGEPSPGVDSLSGPAGASARRRHGRHPRTGPSGHPGIAWGRRQRVGSAGRPVGSAMERIRPRSAPSRFLRFATSLAHGPFCDERSALGQCGCGPLSERADSRIVRGTRSPLVSQPG